MVKRGDTLVEVTLAIGIFSLVAVAVVALVNSSTSSAQTALETTLSREEIDVQAEALRFIHSSYVTSLSQSSSDTKYADIWNTIVAHAIDLSDDGQDAISYRPSTCDELYDKDRMQAQGAFIINPTKLSSDNVNEIVLSTTNDEAFAMFHPTTTYPHLVYQPLEDELSIGNSDEVLSRVEGIYVIAVKDQNTTVIVGNNSSYIPKKSAYYDFYIRTCWYGIGAKRPSTISTVIRLYNPAINSHTQGDGAGI